MLIITINAARVGKTLPHGYVRSRLRQRFWRGCVWGRGSGWIIDGDSMLVVGCVGRRRHSLRSVEYRHFRG